MRDIQNKIKHGIIIPANSNVPGAHLLRGVSQNMNHSSQAGWLPRVVYCAHCSFNSVTARPHQRRVVVILGPGGLRRGCTWFDPLSRRLPLQVPSPLGSLLLSLPLLILQTQLLQLLPE